MPRRGAMVERARFVLKRDIKNAEGPCTAWINEMLCEFIYLNLATTVEEEEINGVHIDYLVLSRRFPPPDVRL